MAVSALSGGICEKGCVKLGGVGAQSIGEVKGEGVGNLQIGGVVEHAELVGNHDDFSLQWPALTPKPAVPSRIVRPSVVL